MSKKENRVKDIYSLSPTQEGMLFHYLMDESKSTYSEQMISKLSGYVDKDVIEGAFQIVHNRHDALRTIFVYKKSNKPRQVVLQNQDSEFIFHDFSSFSEERKEYLLNDFLAKDKTRGFNLSKGPLERLALIKLSETNFILVFSFHHIIIDGWSQSIILKELIEIYLCLSEKNNISLPDAVPYKLFILFLENQDKNAGIAFWKNNISNFESIIDFPGKIKNYSPNYKQKLLKFNIDSIKTNKLNGIAIHNNCTNSALFHTLWGVLLQKYNHTNDIIFGTVVSGRSNSLQNVNNIVGLFINTLPLRVETKEGDSFLDLLKDVQIKLINISNYSYVSLAEIQKNSHFKNNLLTYVLAFQNFPVDVMLANINSNNKIGFKLIENTNVEQTNYDLDINVNWTEEIHIQLRYNEEIYDEQMLFQVSQSFSSLVDLVIQDPEQKVDKLQLITDNKANNLLKAEDNIGYPENETIVSIFNKVVKQFPNNIALKFESEEITYRVLNEKSTAICNWLVNSGLFLEEVVGLKMEKSINMVAAILGILKAGGTYLPIDPEYPANRINYMLDNSHAKFLITENYIPQEIEWQNEVLYLDKLDFNYYNKFETNIEIHPSNLAYIIYTSGTTGLPKGVMVEHRNIVRLFFNDSPLFHFKHDDIWTMFHSFCFDFSVWEMYGALLFGGKLVIVPKMVSVEPKRYLDLLIENKVSIINSTPSAFYNLVAEEAKNKYCYLNARMVIFGGEALHPAKLEKWYKRYPNIRLINMFGITETTVHVTYKEIGAYEIEHNISNIGKAIPTLQTYIFDQNMNFVPEGAKGELYVAGEGLARGYVNNKELTIKRFVNHPLIKNKKLYKTGDLTRLMPNGDLEYLGRIDSQIQLRGFRIELTEIEFQINQIEGVEQSIVICKEENNNQILVAYIISEIKFSLLDIREKLVQNLPNYMIPNYIMFIDKLPLTKNGKIDRLALPEPNLKESENYIAPKNQIEENLTKIWSDVLKVKHVGINDNYFNIGGDSIKAISLLSFINREFNSELKIADLYTAETIENLALKIKEKDHRNDIQEKIEIEKQIIEYKNDLFKIIGAESDLYEDAYPMSDIEKGMIFHSILSPEKALYHDQMIRHIKIKNFNKDVFRSAFYSLSLKHEILRATFNVDTLKEPMQLIHKEPRVDYNHEEIQHLNQTEQEKHIQTIVIRDRQSPYIFEQLPLWRARTFAIGNDNIILFFTCHHAILDGWSDSSLMTELYYCYHKLIDNHAYRPEKLRCSYKDYIVAQFIEKKNQQIIDYWKKELAGYNKIEFSRLNKTEANSSKVKTYFFKEGLLDKLKEYNSKTSTNVKSICFAAYCYILKHFTYHNDFLVGIVSNGRPITEDGDKMLGCFLNTVPYRVRLDSEMSWNEFLTELHLNLKSMSKYDKLPLNTIASLFNEEDFINQNRFFDTIFNFTDFHVFDDFKKDDIEQRIIVDGHIHVNTSLDFSITTTRNEFILNLHYDETIVNEHQVEQLCTLFENILKVITQDDKQKLNNIEIYPDGFLTKYNSTIITEIESDNSYVKEFEKYTKKNPGKTAVVFPIDLSNRINKITIPCEQAAPFSSESFVKEKLTYNQLNERSNQLARQLQKRGLNRNDFVAIMIEPSLEMMISIIGVLKSGGAFLPINPEFPKKRIEFMLSDSNSKLLITHDYLISHVQFSGETIDIDNEDLFDAETSNLNVQISKDDYAYLIYTSGTTGQPKGVIVKHGNLINYTNWFIDKYNLSNDDKTALLTSFAFDLGYTSLFTGILGREIHLIPKDIYTLPRKLIQYIKSEQLTYLKLTPSLFSVLVEEEEFQAGSLESVKHILLGGEKIIAEDVERTYKIYNNLVITNHYGPTETTIGCITNIIDRIRGLDELKAKSIIGKPIDNTQAIILDRNNMQLPDGVAGELIIWGNGVGKGYLNQDKLNNEKFRFIDLIAPSTFYKTGDMARILPDKSIEFIGRIDDQVKINGFRIETKEIEIQLKSFHKLKDAKVLVRNTDQNEPKLCAYYITMPTTDQSKIVAKSLQGNLTDPEIITNNTSNIEFTPIQDFTNGDIIRLFKDHCLNNPKQVAINSDLGKISFGDLNKASDTIARILDEKYCDQYALSKPEKIRYKRQLLLKDWGIHSQEKLKSSKVFVAGAGGGASPTIMQLALAGIGTIKVCDFDIVELSNLNRQFLHDESRIGMNKALSAQETIKKVNPYVNLIPITEKLTEENIHEIIGDVDIIFDMFDGQAEKFLLSEYATKNGIPHVISAMTDLNSYFAIFHAPQTACFHCVFDSEKLKTIIEGMSSHVKNYQKQPLAVASTSLFQSSSFAVNEAIKILLNFENPAYNKFFYINHRGADQISESYSYKSMTYTLKDCFKRECKKKGFDWEVGWRGKFLEELDIIKDPNCSICNGENSDSIKKPIAVKSEFHSAIKSNNKKSVGLMLNDKVKKIQAILAILKSGMSAIILDQNSDNEFLKDILSESGSRVIIADESTLRKTNELKKLTNKNIEIINIDDIYFSDETINHESKDNNIVAFLRPYVAKNGEIAFEEINYNDIKSRINIKSNDQESELSKSIAQHDSLLKFGIYSLNELIFGQTITINKELNNEEIEAELKEYIARELPYYMMPHYFINMEKYPVNENGKIDFKSFPDPFKFDKGREITLARNEIESLLVNIWSDLLNKKEISIHDNFFTLGGDSIKSIQIESRIRKNGYELSMQDIFEYPTIAQISAKIKKINRESFQGNIIGNIPLTPIQNYFFEHHKTDLHHYNQSVLLIVKQKLTKDILTTIFNKIATHHDALRMTFKLKDNTIIQYNNDIDLCPEIFESDLTNNINFSEELISGINKIHSSFSLENGPLIKIGLFHLPDSDRLFIAVHHLIIDGISWRIIFEDLQTLYQQVIQNKKLFLPNKSDSYKFWSEKLIEYANSESISNNLKYWKEFGKLNHDEILPQVDNIKGKLKDIIKKRISLESEKTQMLLEETHHAYGTTINDILITSVGLSLKSCFKGKRFLISMEGHGRERLNSDVDISRTIGWHSSVYPFIIDVTDESLSKSIIKIKDDLHKIPNNGIDFGVIKYLLKNDDSLAINKIKDPQILFNYLGQFNEDISNKFFLISNENNGISSSQNTESDYLLTISSIIQTNELEFTIHYDQRYFTETIIEQLLINIKNELIKIINHCNTKRERELTSSDMTDKNLSGEEFELITNLFD